MNQGSMAAVMAAHAVGRSATAAKNEADPPATVTTSAIRSENRTEVNDLASLRSFADDWVGRCAPGLTVNAFIVHQCY